MSSTSGLAAGVLLHKRIQQRLLACRNDHLRTLGVQLRGHGAANAAGGTHQPHTLAAPVRDGRVQRHGAAPVPFGERQQHLAQR